jgi:hypothetical protein
MTLSDHARRTEVMPSNSFRRRHEAIALAGDDFILGETFGMAGTVLDRTVRYFRYTPAGALVTYLDDDQAAGGGLALRLDGLGRIYLRDDGYVRIVANGL